MSGSVDLARETSAYKTYGRTYLGEKGINVDFAGNGIELDAECEGDVYIRYSCEASVYLQVSVDGEPGLRPCTEVGDRLTLKIAEGLDCGDHNIRIIRDSDASKTGALMAIDRIDFDGKAENIRAPEDKELYIEFIGDSITAGKYTEMQYVEGEAIHKVTNSYAYLTASELDCDFSIIARGGCGFFRTSTCPMTMTQLYPYYNGFLSEPREYKPERRADVVVLAMGTNDGVNDINQSIAEGRTAFSCMEDALADQIGRIRRMHGESVRIVVLQGMMTSAWADECERVSKEHNTYFLRVTKNRDGGRNHPSSEGHKVIARELCDYIKNTVLG